LPYCKYEVKLCHWLNFPTHRHYALYCNVIVPFVMHYCDISIQMFIASSPLEFSRRWSRKSKKILTTDSFWVWKVAGTGGNQLAFNVCCKKLGR